MNGKVFMRFAYESRGARHVVLGVGKYSMSSGFPHAYQNGNGPLGKQNTPMPGQAGSKPFRPGTVYGMPSTFQLRHVACAECQHFAARAYRILYVGFCRG